MRKSGHDDDYYRKLFDENEHHSVLGEWTQRRRVEGGLTREICAKMLGVDTNRWEALELGLLPTDEEIMKIARIFKVDLEIYEQVIIWSKDSTHRMHERLAVKRLELEQEAA